MATKNEKKAMEYANKEYPEDPVMRMAAYRAFLAGCSYNAHSQKKKTSDGEWERDYISPLFEEPFNLWLDYKKERKQSYATERTERTAYDKLVELSHGDHELAMDIVKQSISSNWSGLFPYKGQAKPKSEAQKRFLSWVNTFAPLVALMPIQPTDIEIAELRAMPTAELQSILTQINNKKWLSDNRNSVYQTVMEVRSYGK